MDLNILDTYMYLTQIWECDYAHVQIMITKSEPCLVISNVLKSFMLKGPATWNPWAHLPMK